MSKYPVLSEITGQKSENNTGMPKVMWQLNLTTNIAKSHNNYMHQQRLLNLTTNITKSYNNYLHQQKLLNLTTKITKSNNNHTSKLYS